VMLRAVLVFAVAVSLAEGLDRVFVSYVQGSTLDVLEATARPDVLCLAFAYPGTGTSVSAADLMKGFTQSGTVFDKSSISAAQSQGTKVVASLGGWTYRDTFPGAIDDWGGALAHATWELVNTYGLDGVDIDLEGTIKPSSTDAIRFFRSLRQSLGSSKLITYTIQSPNAFNKQLGKDLVDEGGLLDWINVMEYNNNVGDIQTDFVSYQQFGIPASKLVLGLMPGYDDVQVCTSAAEIASHTEYILSSGYKGIMTWNINRDLPSYTGMTAAGGVSNLILGILRGGGSSSGLPSTCPNAPAIGKCNGAGTSATKCKPCSIDSTCGAGGACWKVVSGC